MQKKAQMMPFVILGILFIFMVVILYLVATNGSKQTLDTTTQNTQSNQVDTLPLKTFIESCLVSKTEEGALLIGRQGGYISPGGNPLYHDLGTIDYTPFGVDSVPYYIIGSTVKQPTLEEIELKLSNYILVELGSCLDFSTFRAKGYKIDEDKTTISLSVKINSDDIQIDLLYPLTITKNSVKNSLTAFSARVPVRIGALYTSADYMIRNIILAGGSYDLSSECDRYDTNGVTNIYVKLNGGNQEIVQFQDISTRDTSLRQTTTFQFAVKDVQLSGACTG